jgi:hypothetical protein
VGIVIQLLKIKIEMIMQHKIKNLLLIGLLATTVFSCKKEEGPTTDLRPSISVTVPNAIAYRPEPTVSTTLATTDSIITIKLAVSSGRTIKEVTKVAASTSYTQIQSTGATGFYTLGTVAGLNTAEVTFTTSIRQYYTVHPVTAATGANPPPVVNAELARRFYFLLTLDDNSKIVTNPVRVLVL